jgi:hypothetical protein
MFKSLCEYSGEQRETEGKKKKKKEKKHSLQPHSRKPALSDCLDVHPSTPQSEPLFAESDRTIAIWTLSNSVATSTCHDMHARRYHIQQRRRGYKKH